MNQEYKCPYCGQNSYAKTSKNIGLYNNWNAVIKHLSHCTKVNYSYIIFPEYGPIPVEEILTTESKKLKQKYPKVSFHSKMSYLRKIGILKSIPSFKIAHSKQTIIETIQKFYKIHNRIPGIRDFGSNNPDYPNHDTVKSHFNSWNLAIEAAGFTPNIQNGFGIDTYGLDTHLYRSTCEAYFADTYLFNKVAYEIEPKYPKPYNKYYDWYLPKLNLYVELDGEIRPQVIKEKIEINKLLKRNCLFIKTADVYNFKGFET